MRAQHILSYHLITVGFSFFNEHYFYDTFVLSFKPLRIARIEKSVI